MLLHDVSLSDYTSWRVGGIAKTVFKPDSIESLQKFLSQLSAGEPVLSLGLGSNVLVRDKGFDGTVIIFQGGLQSFEYNDAQIVRAEAGMSCAALARKTARLGLAGLEFMAGIPGTVGGALRMNAGCHGGETWSQVLSVETIDRYGECHHRVPESFEIAYRSVQGLAKDEYFVAGTFKLMQCESSKALDKIRHLVQRRTATQPTGEYSCGSVFRNPHDDYAARLIESCGLKGHAIGQAMVSEKHANFIINQGAAKSKDIEDLIEAVADRVYAKTNITLKREVHIIGEA